jgi:hypothetical protein
MVYLAEAPEPQMQGTKHVPQMCCQCIRGLGASPSGIFVTPSNVRHGQMPTLGSVVHEWRRCSFGRMQSQHMRRLVHLWPPVRRRHAWADLELPLRRGR